MSEKPVIVTGSARPHTAAIYDGGLNFLTSFIAAGGQSARNRGVMVVFSDRILSPRHAAKINFNQPDLFEAGDAGNLSTFVNVQPVFFPSIAAFRSPSFRHKDNLTGWRVAARPNGIWTTRSSHRCPNPTRYSRTCLGRVRRRLL
ncbi:Asparaginase/glutaminase, partial [Dactylonectria macrodidyma]